LRIFKGLFASFLLKMLMKHIYDARLYLVNYILLRQMTLFFMSLLKNVIKNHILDFSNYQFKVFCQTFFYDYF